MKKGALERGYRAVLDERVRDVAPNRKFLAAIANASNEDLSRMLNEFDLTLWKTAVQATFIQPILNDIAGKFQGSTRIGVRGSMTSVNGSMRVLYPTAPGLVESVRLPTLRDLVINGTDRPSRPVVDVYPCEGNRMYEPALAGFCEMIIKFFKSAQGQNDYSTAMMKPVLCVYDLSLLIRDLEGKAYLLPEDEQTRSRVIKAVYPFDVTPLLPEEL